MSPTGKYVTKCVLIALYAVLVSLQVALPGLTADEVLSAVIAGGIGGLGYAGIGAATSLGLQGRANR